MHDDFLEAAIAGPLEKAEALRPETTLYTAAVRGDADALRPFLADVNVNTKGGPLGWDALTYLCFSQYLRAGRPGFGPAARLLLEAGANPNAGWWDNAHKPEPEWESVLYGAAGLAHHEELTRLLLEFGADPNDNETPYHSPETYDNGALRALVESGRLRADSLATMLLRKTDWHDLDGLVYLLEQGADPNWPERLSLRNAVLRDNALPAIEALLDHGADPAQAAGLAARRGRADVLELLEKRGQTVALTGLESLLEACARNRHAPGTAELLAIGGRVLAEFSGNGNVDGVRRLLDLGVDVNALYAEGDGYYGIAPQSTALHVAAWRIHPATARLLIERGARVDATDGQGFTPLALAVKGCVDSYWSRRRTPAIARSLIEAGARREVVPHPCGYAEIDALLLD